MIYTFGFGHVCPGCGLELRNCYIALPDRDAMVVLFGIKWANEYATEEDAGVARFELKQVFPGDACACGGYGREPWLAKLDDLRVAAKLANER
jgi:hypothetical protein